MKKIIDYRIIESPISDKLSDAVIVAMSFGWQPFGNLISVQVSDKISFCQTVVKYEE